MRQAMPGSENTHRRSVFDTPVLHASTIRARWASACAVFGRRARRSSASRSSAVTSNWAPRPVTLLILKRAEMHGSRVPPFSLCSSSMDQIVM